MLSSAETYLERIWNFQMFRPLGTHRAIAAATATVLTPPTNAKKILIQALTHNVRYTLDGSTPAPTAGFRLTAGNDPYIITLVPGMIVTVIEESATADIEYQWGE